MPLNCSRGTWSWRINPSWLPGAFLAITLEFLWPIFFFSPSAYFQFLSLRGETSPRRYISCSKERNYFSLPKSPSILRWGQLSRLKSRAAKEPNTDNRANSETYEVAISQMTRKTDRASTYLTVIYSMYPSSSSHKSWRSENTFGLLRRDGAAVQFSIVTAIKK